MKAAVVGAGIAGLAAAHALVRAGHTVTLYEAAPRAGGHVHTVAVDGHAIDMGFIVCNRENYPGLFALFAELGVHTRPTTMSFSVSPGPSPAGPALFDWSTSAPFADRRALASPRHWWLLGQVTAFMARARQDVALATGISAGSSIALGAYLDAIKASPELREQFVIPLVSALWSMAWDRCLEFPARSFLRFLDHHGMLRLVRPLAWHTVVGGSRTYVDALLAALAGSGRFTLRLSTPITLVERSRGGVDLHADRFRGTSDERPLGAGIVRPERAEHERFDRVVIATAADLALEILDAPTADEQRVLGAFTYAENHTVLHTDRRFLPAAPAAHAAWNVVRAGDRGRVAVTYSMTKLQGLPDAPYLVTLNPRTRPRGVLHEVAFRHPQFDTAALRAQAELPTLSGGERRTYFAGAYAGNGFHEHGLQSGALAAQRVIDDEARPQVEETATR